MSYYKFTDQELDAEVGLYNYNARLYDPAVGIFISPDSIVPDWYDPQLLNRYAYVRNNPLIYVDPSGHSIDPADHDSMSGLKDSIDSSTSGDESDQGGENNDNFEIAKTDFSEYEDALRRTKEEMDAQRRRAMELSIGLGSSMIGPVLGLPIRITPKKPLNRLHPDSTLKPSKLEGIRKKSTDEIVDSLKSSGKNQLKVRSDGTVIDGNHRIKVLEERGYDTSKLFKDADVIPKKSIAP